MATNEKLKTASVLAFERKIDPSDTIFYAGKWADQDKHSAWSPIEIREKAVRGTISNREKTTSDKDIAALDAKVEKPNLQTVDIATLPYDADTLKVKFTLRVLANLAVPCTCNNQDYQQKLTQTIDKYIHETGLDALAYRYAYNLANGRFLWRNRLSSEQIQVRITYQIDADAEKKTAVFNAFDFSLTHFDCPKVEQEKLAEITGVISRVLSGEQPYALIEVVAFARMGEGQEVFPSQELMLEKTKKSKTLYQIKDVAAMHSQKVGNAIRTIDTWYENGSEATPISVEPYGSVTSQGKAYRKSKNDFYTLLDNWILKDQKPEIEQQHYVIAGLIRGGIFGASGKE